MRDNQFPQWHNNHGQANAPGKNRKQLFQNSLLQKLENPLEVSMETKIPMPRMESGMGIFMSGFIPECSIVLASNLYQSAWNGWPQCFNGATIAFLVGSVWFCERHAGLPLSVLTFAIHLIYSGNSQTADRHNAYSDTSHDPGDCTRYFQNAGSSACWKSNSNIPHERNTSRWHNMHIAPLDLTAGLNYTACS